MIRQTILASLKRATGLDDVHLESPDRSENGEYTTNIALKDKSQTSQEIIDKLNKDKNLMEVVEKVEVAGPGFINFYLKNDVLFNNLKQIESDMENYGREDLGKGKTVVIDYSAPNIAKRFSIGHLRSTVIGQALYNLYKFQGYKTIGDNHLGDWGTQFGVLIYMVKSQNLDPKKLKVEDWEKLYVHFHSELKEDESLKDKAREEFKNLESGEKQAREIWQAAYDISIAEYERIYNLLNVKIDHAYGESFYEDKMAEVIKEAKDKGLATNGEKGALIMEFDDMSPAMLVKSDGTTTYFTRDLATIKYRLKTWNPDIFIYEVGSDQILHFRQVFETVKKLGWADNKEFVHVAHGLVRLPEGKMSTRRGQTIKLEEVLDGAVERAKKFNEDDNLAKPVGIGAIKYFDLMHSPTSDIIFDWEKIFVLEGNSGPYLQYTYARTQSVLAKSKDQPQISKVDKLEPEEREVARLLAQFQDIISMSTKNYSPNTLCEYLYNLASAFNGFYQKHKIIDSENEKFRILLTKGVGQVMKNGLTLLGIQTPERM